MITTLLLLGCMPVKALSVLVCVGSVIAISHRTLQPMYARTNDADLHLCSIVLGQAQHHGQDKHALCLLRTKLEGVSALMI